LSVAGCSGVRSTAIEVSSQATSTSSMMGHVPAAQTEARSIAFDEQTIRAEPPPPLVAVAERAARSQEVAAHSSGGALAEARGAAPAYGA
jgi:hypothetical protein